MRYTWRRHHARPQPSDIGSTYTLIQEKRTNDEANKNKSKMLCTICKKGVIPVG